MSRTLARLTRYRGSIMYIVLGLILLLSVTGLWPYALIVIGLLLVLLFGAVVIGMTLHDEEAYLNKKFGMDEKDDEDNGKW